LILGSSPGWERSRRTDRGWWEFRSGDRRLRIKNIDATNYEAKSGADLVYLRRNPDALVLVQYKMLTPGKDGRFEYVEDLRLRGQLERMQSICRSSASISPTCDTYRLGHGASFVKFVEPPSGPQHLDELPTGYYLPSEYALVLFPQRSPGSPRNRVKAPLDRYLDSETFVRLIRDVWVGTLSDATDRLTAFLGVVGGAGSADLVFAYEDVA
jgi:hypothetical protein